MKILPIPRFNPINVNPPIAVNDPIAVNNPIVVNTPTAVNTPICPIGQEYAQTNSFRCYSPQCKNFANGLKCPTEGHVEVASAPGCVCQSGYAYINEVQCIPEASAECGGRGKYWDGSLIEKSMTQSKSVGRTSFAFIFVEIG